MIDIYYDFTLYEPKEYKPYGLDRIKDKPWSFFSNLIDQVFIKGGSLSFDFSEANYLTENPNDGIKSKDYDAFLMISDPKYGYLIEWFSRENIDSSNESYKFKGLFRNFDKSDKSTVFFDEIEFDVPKKYLFSDIHVAKVFFKSIYDSRELPENRFEIFKNEL